MVSQTISHYRIIKKLGEGGMGEVYLAEDIQLGRKVALKLLPPDFVKNTDRLRRFEQEARAASALNHPNVLTIFEMGSVESIYFIATEFIEGETLQKHLDSSRMKLSEVLEIIIQTANALDAAHGAGIIHRDIKPANIMLRPDGYIKLLDFGLAKLTETKPSEIDTEAPTNAKLFTDPGTVMGTVSYMSPEQARGRLLDERTDIFSLGIMLYEMVTGRMPFDGESPADIIAAIIYKEPPPLSKFSEGLPDALQSIITKALCKDREERYQKVKELLADLKTLKRRLDLESDLELSGSLPPVRTSTNSATKIQVPGQTAEQKEALPSDPASNKKTSRISVILDGMRSYRRAALISSMILIVAIAGISIGVYKNFNQELKIPLKSYTLSNGMRVILSEDHSTPTFSICVTYNVGSRNESPGRTGFAHLFEHMMFQGSENVGKGEHFLLIQNNGGNMNGKTSRDNTQFFQTLPSNQLELGLFLEADRMRGLVINQANFTNQKQAVQGERLQSGENQSVTKVIDAAFETAYDNFPYKHPSMGSFEDLDAAKLEEVTAFYKSYYAPNNAVLTLVGDFKSEETLAKIKKYFEEIPKQPIPELPNLIESEQKEERRKTIEDPYLQAPILLIGYKIPPGNTPEYYAMELLNRALGSGQSSRLYQKLVKEKEVATYLSSFNYQLRGTSFFLIILLARPGKDLAQIEKIILEEIEKLKDEPLGDQEIEKVLVQLRRQHLQQLPSTFYRSYLMGQYAVDYNDPELINTFLDKFRSVKKDDIQLAVRTYLKETNRTVITCMPGQTGVQTVKASPKTANDSNNPEVSKIERKNRAPVSKDILTLKLPNVVEETLDNGLTVLILEDERFPIVQVEFDILGAGPLYEPTDLPGLADMTAQMLKEGTKSYTSKQLAENFESRGGFINASAQFGTDRAVISASGFSTDFDQWFPMTADILLNPTFPVDDLNTVKQRMKIQLQQLNVTPPFLARQVFNRVLFGNHPAGVLAATSQSIDAITPEALTKWHKERYAPQNTILGIVGNVRAKDLMPKLKNWLSGWQKKEIKEIPIPNTVPAATRKIYLVDRPNSPQTTILMGNIAVDRRDPDYIPMVAMNRILGESPASRLFIKLREEKGYTYSAFSNFLALNYPGPWTAQADVRAEVTEEAIGDFLTEIRRINEEKVSQSELDESTRSVAASFALSLEKPSKMLSYAISRKIYGFSADYWSTYPGKIMGVSVEDVNRFSRKYLNPEAIQIVVVGDAEKIKSGLEKYGPVEIYKADSQ